MLVGDNLLYENKHFIIINDIAHDTFYYFDYDERDYALNMEFEHYHPFFELFLLLGPEADHLIEGHPYHLQTNDLVLLAPSRLHKSIYPKGEPSKRVVISFMFPEDFFQHRETYEKLLEPFNAEVPIYRFEPKDRRLLFDILNDLFTYSSSPSYKGNDLDAFYVHTKFQEFLFALYQVMDANIYKDSTSYNSIERKIYDITAYIHANYSDELTLESLAEMFYISPCYLSHQFKSVTHFTLVNYIQMTRIRNVEYRLIATNDKISDIAESCGFTSFSQFNRIFKKITGTSPSDFRKGTGSGL